MQESQERVSFQVTPPYLTCEYSEYYTPDRAYCPSLATTAKKTAIRFELRSRAYDTAGAAPSMQSRASGRAALLRMRIRSTVLYDEYSTGGAFDAPTLNTRNTVRYLLSLSSDILTDT